MVDQLAIGPVGARTLDVLQATATGIDADGDPVSLRYQWTVGGRARPVERPSLTPDQFRKGQAVVETVTPSDGESTGAPARSAALTIENTPPTAPVVVVGDPAGGTRDLVCHLLSEGGWKCQPVAPLRVRPWRGEPESSRVSESCRSAGRLRCGSSRELMSPGWRERSTAGAVVLSRTTGGAVGATTSGPGEWQESRSRAVRESMGTS